MKIRPVIEVDDAKDLKRTVEDYADEHNISQAEAWHRLVRAGLDAEADNDE